MYSLASLSLHAFSFSFSLSNIHSFIHSFNAVVPASSSSHDFSPKTRHLNSPSTQIHIGFTSNPIWWRWCQDMLPKWKEIRFEHAWYALSAITSSKMPPPSLSAFTPVRFFSLHLTFLSSSFSFRFSFSRYSVLHAPAICNAVFFVKGLLAYSCYLYLIPLIFLIWVFNVLRSLLLSDSWFWWSGFLLNIPFNHKGALLLIGFILWLQNFVLVAIAWRER